MHIHQTFCAICQLESHLRPNKIARKTLISKNLQLAIFFGLFSSNLHDSLGNCLFFFFFHCIISLFFNFTAWFLLFCLFSFFSVPFRILLFLYFWCLTEIRTCDLPCKRQAGALGRTNNLSTNHVYSCLLPSILSFLVYLHSSVSFFSPIINPVFASSLYYASSFKT